MFRSMNCFSSLLVSHNSKLFNTSAKGLCREILMRFTWAWNDKMASFALYTCPWYNGLYKSRLFTRWALLSLSLYCWSMLAACSQPSFWAYSVRGAERPIYPENVSYHQGAEGVWTYDVTINLYPIFFYRIEDAYQIESVCEIACICLFFDCISGCAPVLASKWGPFLKFHHQIENLLSKTYCWDYSVNWI